MPRVRFHKTDEGVCDDLKAVCDRDESLHVVNMLLVVAAAIRLIYAGADDNAYT